jgi:hypothetical protein
MQLTASERLRLHLRVSTYVSFASGREHVLLNRAKQCARQLGTPEATSTGIGHAWPNDWAGQA